MCTPQQGAGGATTKVLWFGDSIVLGTNTPNRQGMRRPHWDYLLSIGARPEFVGTLAADPGGMTHTRHDGHAGHEMERLRDEYILPHFGAGKTIPHADLVICHMGSNNLGSPSLPPFDPEDTPALYYELLELLHAAFPAARICPATVGPFDRAGFADLDDNAQILNAALTGDVIPDFEVAYPGIIVPGWDANMCLNNGVWSVEDFDADDPSHPNPTGSAKQVQTPNIGLIARLVAAGIHA